MNFDSQLYYLSQVFYQKYPNPPFSEILYNKNGRAYNCLIIEAKENYFICIPFRSNMKHKYGYRFRNSARSKRSKSGLDYKKMVIIDKSEYLDSTNSAVVDQDEYNETIINLARITREANCFLDDYISYIKGNPTISPEEFERRYKESPLQYFHLELGLL